MRESCALRLTIRYLLMFVHRRDLEQSSVSRSLASDRVWVCYAKSHLYTLLFLEKIAKSIKYKNPVDSLILVWGGMRAGFGLGVFEKKFSANNLVSRHTILTKKNGEFQIVLCLTHPPVRAQIPAVFRKYYKTAGIAPLKPKNKKDD